jgi:hypothetical protein
MGDMGDDEQKASKVVRAQITEAVRRAPVVVGSLRQLVNGALLGTCVVFLATMLSLPHLDPPLHVALVAITCAIPFLVWGFMWASSSFSARPAAPLLQEFARAAAHLELLG